MSTKRILGISVFGLLFIAVAVGVILQGSYHTSDIGTVQLPDTSASTGSPVVTEPDALDRVEVTRDTVQSVISTLSRPDTYSREVTIESFWKDGQAEYSIEVVVRDGATSLRMQPSVGAEKRIIVTPDKLYIWYKGDRTPYVGELGSAGDRNRTADEWQMLSSYEDILALDKNDITDAGYTEYGGRDCVYAIYLSPLLDYTIKYYVSIEMGLVTGAEEYDEAGMLVYSMSAGECAIGDADPAAFILPDGTEAGAAESGPAPLR